MTQGSCATPATPNVPVDRYAFISFALTRWKLLGTGLAIVRKGTHRHVCLLGSYAIKRPVFRPWRMFLCGLLANLQEATFSATGWTKLCPVVWRLPGGFLNVMRRATPLTQEEFAALNYNKWKWVDESPEGPFGEWVIPVENKIDSFGKLDGRIVAVDYGS